MKRSTVLRAMADDLDFGVRGRGYDCLETEHKPGLHSFES